MATVTNAGAARPEEAIAALVAAGGTAGAAHATVLRASTATTRDLADAVHAFCALHGTAPGIVELAADAHGDEGVRAYLRAAADLFAAERASLVALTAAVGPLPSTPGQAESAAAVGAQRHALATLARSDRAGCAVGAAWAFLLDWETIRDVLVRAAARAGVDYPTGASPVLPALADALGRIAPTAGHDRAMLFGAQQLLAQHAGLWQLLEARASARRG